MKSHELYRFYAATGALLYVGLTDSAQRRVSEHRRDKPWWRHVVRIEIERFSSRQELMRAEVDAITTEKPRYNIVHALPQRPIQPKRRPVAPWGNDANRFTATEDDDALARADGPIHVRLHTPCPECNALALCRNAEHGTFNLVGDVHCQVCGSAWDESVNLISLAFDAPTRDKVR